MKKTKDIILSLVLPRKMAKYRNMHYILALFIYLMGMFLVLASQFMMSEKFVSDEMERTEFEESLNVKGNPTFGKYMQTISFSTDSDISVPEEEAPQITKELCIETFKTTNGDLVDVLIGFDENYDGSEKSQTTFFYDKNNYSKLNRENETIIYIFTKNRVYYGQNINVSLTKPEKGNLTDEAFEKAKVTFSKSIYEEFSYVTRYEEENSEQIDKFTSILSYLRRLKNVDKVTFVQKMNQKLGINISVSSLVESSLTSYDEYTNSYFATKGIYHAICQDKIKGENNITKLDLTIVIDVNMDIDEDHKSFTYFDYEGYMKQERVEDTTYILCVYTSRRFFYAYDLCQKLSGGKYLSQDYSGTSIFEKTNAGNYKLFLPASIDELAYNEYGELDTTLWTKEAKEDDRIDFEVTIPGINSEDIKPVDRHKKNLEDALYTNLSRSYQYNELQETRLITKSNYLKGSLNLYLQSVVESMIAVNASSYELIYGIMAFAIYILFPLVLVLIVWLMSRKLFMKKIRQYYAIGAICYVETGLIGFILGFFLPFDKFALYFMLFQAWYFIFVTFRINTDPQYNNDETNNDNNASPKDEKLEFKKINDSNTSQIG